MQTINSPPTPKKNKSAKGEEGLYENGHKWLTHVLHCHGIELSAL